MDRTPARPGRKSRHAATSAVGALLAVVLVVLLPPASAWAAPPAELPANAPAADRRWQPALDYDTDGCYPTPAIGPDGTLNGGLKNSGSLDGGCRDAADLTNTNAYSRSKCNNGWCAYVYGLYFEKDQAVPGLDCCGHRHDWEHVVVWVSAEQVRYVSVSEHGGYRTHDRAQIAFDGTHPKIVYHKDGSSTHCFRAAGPGEVPENHLAAWQYPALVGWDGFPPGVRDRLTRADFGAAVLALRDGDFAAALAKAEPAGIPFDPRA